MASLNRLILCDGISPNTKGNIYYIFDKPAFYFDNVLSSHKVAVIDEPNYRINNGKAIISTEGTISSGVTSFTRLQGITYIADRRTDTIAGGYYWTFYHVSKVYFQAGKCYMDLSLDDFANGMQKAVMEHGEITRLGAYKDDGSFPFYLDTPAYFPESYTNVDGHPISAHISQADIVFIAQIRFETTGDLFGNSPVSNTLNFCFTSSSVAKAMTDLGTVFAVATSKNAAGTLYYEGKAQVVQAWAIARKMLPDVLSLSPAGTFRAKFKDLSNGYDDAWLCGGLAYPYPQTQRYIYSYDLPQQYGYQYYIGTRKMQLKVPRQLPSTHIEIETTLNNSGLRVLLRIGEEVTDITGQFTLPITMNNDIATDSEKIIGGLQTATGVLSKVSKTYEKNGSMGVGYLGYSTLLSQYHFNEPQPSIGQGDGDMTFEYEKNDGTYNYFYFPIRTFEKELIGNVGTSVSYRGGQTSISFADADGTTKAGVREFLSDLMDKTKWTPLGYMSPTTSGIYVQGDIDVGQIPEQNRKAIADAFKDGIRIIYVKSSS